MIFKVFLSLLLAGVAWAGPHPVLPADGIPWAFPATPAGAVAVGDIHGDFRALCWILYRRGLIDEHGHWAGGAVQVVVIGDLIDRGPDSRSVMTLLMRLEAEAAAAGGRIESLLGNHEWMVVGRRDYRFALRDIAHYADWIEPEFALNPTQNDRDRAMRRSLSGEAPLGRWIRRRNALVRIGDTLFSHAGIESWAAEVGAAEVNATVRAWFAHEQGALPTMPPLDTQWVIGRRDGYRGLPGDVGPMWTNAFSPDPRENQGVTIERLPLLLAGYGARRLVVGHIMTPRHEVILDHRRYGRRVLMIDTAISDFFDNSMLSTLELPHRGQPTARYYDRPTEWPAWIERLATALRLDSMPPAGGCGPKVQTIGLRHPTGS